ncbi:Pr6Pr family membrane protein [Nocardia sp. NPDC004068]|uniref:Pr6Pr family membrane protein n=1 Tax=Nocardia sp. NPDC004068 TaxID=3364303 RepID=UPI0036B1D6B5
METGVGAPWWVRGLRVGFGVLGVVVVLWLPVRDGGNAGFSVGNYFSYFTIESNVLGAVVLLVGGVIDPRGRRWQVARGAAALYLLITGVVYAVLLANVDVSLTDQWINHTLHRVQPIVMVIDWLVVPAGLGVSARLVGAWLIYPAVYGAYSLIRGPIVDWYPYPFLDPRTQGYPSMLIGLVILAAVFALLAAAVAWVGDLREPRRAESGVARRG